MSQVNYWLRELDEVQKRLATAVAEAEAKADKEAATGGRRYAIMTGHLEAVVQTAAERLNEIGKALHRLTMDPEPPEPGEAEGDCILNLIDALHTKRAQDGWERALLEVFRQPQEVQKLIRRLEHRVSLQGQYLYT